jgi:hypothetical protein
MTTKEWNYKSIERKPMPDEGRSPPNAGIKLPRPWRQQADKSYFAVT